MKAKAVPFVNEESALTATGPLELAKITWSRFQDAFDGVNDDCLEEEVVQGSAICVGLLAKRVFETQTDVKARLPQFLDESQAILKACIEGRFMEEVIFGILDDQTSALVAHGVFILEELQEVMEDVDANPDLDTDEALLALGICLGLLVKRAGAERDYVATAFLGESLISPEILDGQLTEEYVLSIADRAAALQT